VKILYEEAKWKSIASALEKVNEAHKYDNKYEHADDLFKDSKSEIADKDIDRAISFSPQTYQPEAKPIREKYKKLYDYAKGIGKIIDEKVDEPFYKSIDEYMQKMADMNVSAYTTANTINVQTGPFFNRHDKKEIKLTDLYEADTEYSDNLKAEYEAWKLQNPDVKASQEDYETAALNSGAFEYEGIRTGQEKKEFWFNLIATGVVVGLTIVCPPAGLVAGAAYTAIDVGGAITGEDLISGRKLSDNERLVRGAFAIVPGAGAAAGKALLKNMPALANVMKSAYKTVENAGGSALKSTLEHARNLGKAHGDQLKFTLKHPVLAAVTSKAGQQTVRQSAKFIDNALRPIEVRAVQTTAGKIVTGVERGLPSGKLPAKADEYLATKQAEKDGVLAGKGTSEKVKEKGDINDPIRTYRGADLSKLEAKYTADPRLTVEMPYVGKGQKNTNSEGWLRDKDFYWKEMLEKYPEAFNRSNRQKIELGFAPTNNPTFRKHFPQYDLKELYNDTLIHHHIGGGGQAVAVPSKLHPGLGGIHNAEKSAGVWGNDQKYAELLEKFLEK